MRFGKKNNQSPVEITDEQEKQKEQLLKSEIRQEEASSAESERTTEATETVVTIEPDGATSVKPTVQLPVRKAYSSRYYLLYGGTEIPEGIDLNGTSEFLKAYGFGDGALKRARDGRSTAELIEKTFEPNRPGSRYCDFCGNELIGTEYDVLRDGRERCISCGRTAVRSEAEFINLYKTVTRNMEAFYGVRIGVPIQINMVNARKLHKQLGKTFVPTSQMDARTLGVAIRDKEGYRILLENGSPRLMATMTMVHELTHIWQYLNWDAAKIKALYGAEQELQIYEGMAKWSEIQYAYLIGEIGTAKRQEIITRARNDAYGIGFQKYVSVYPLSYETRLKGLTPFENPLKPL